MLISAWGCMCRKSLPSEFIFTAISTWLEADSTVLFTPLMLRSNLWLTVIKPEHYSDGKFKIKIHKIIDQILDHTQTTLRPPRSIQTTPRPLQTTRSNKSFVLDYIKSCGAADLIAWTIRLSFMGDREKSAKFHWLVLKSISQADRVVKRMAKNLPSQNLVKIWTRQDVHSLVGELMKKGQEHKDQVSSDLIFQTKFSNFFFRLTKRGMQ